MRPSAVVAQFIILQLICDWRRWKLGHDWRRLRSQRRHDTTRLRCRQIVQTRRDCHQLVANSIHTADAIGSVYWALVIHCQFLEYLLMHSAVYAVARRLSSLAQCM